MLNKLIRSKLEKQRLSFNVSEVVGDPIDSVKRIIRRNLFNSTEWPITFISFIYIDILLLRSALMQKNEKAA